MFSNLGAYSNSLKPQPKDREGLRLFAESKAIMTCFDLSNFLFWPSLPYKTHFSAESVLIYKKNCQIKVLIRLFC